MLFYEKINSENTKITTTEENAMLLTKSKDAITKPDFSQVQVHKKKNKTLIIGTADLFIFNEPPEVKKAAKAIFTPIPAHFEENHADGIISHTAKNNSRITKPAQIKKISFAKKTNFTIIALLVLIVANIIFILQEVNILDFEKIDYKFKAVSYSTQATVFVSKKDPLDTVLRYEP